MKEYWLYLFYKDVDHETSSAIHELVTSFSKADAYSSLRVGIIILEWDSVDAFINKKRYDIFNPHQCALTNSYRQSILRFSRIPKSLTDLSDMLIKLGYLDIAEKLQEGKIQK